MLMRKRIWFLKNSRSATWHTSNRIRIPNILTKSYGIQGFLELFLRKLSVQTIGRIWRNNFDLTYGDRSTGFLRWISCSILKAVRLQWWGHRGHSYFTGEEASGGVASQFFTTIPVFTYTGLNWSCTYFFLSYRQVPTPTLYSTGTLNHIKWNCLVEVWHSFVLLYAFTMVRELVLHFSARPLTLTHAALFGVLLHLASLQSLALEKAWG